jgi:signal transduction histidine kinase
MASPATRASAARALARELGGNDLLLFLSDPEVQMLLPAPGFPAALPNGRVWAAFLTETVAHGEFSADLPVGRPDRFEPVTSFACGRDIVCVLVGTRAASASVEWLRTLLPMFASIFRAERAALLATAHEKAAREAAARAETLTAGIDRMRRQLEAALADSREARLQLERANVELNSQAQELREANDQLQEQAAELEAQTEELSETVRELEAARTEAAIASQAKSDFLATMSHELRTPLNAIGGHAQLIEIGVYGPVTDEQRAALERIERSQRHLLGLINDILNLARIESGRVEYSVSKVGISDAFADLKPMIGPQFLAKGIGFEMEGLEGCPAVRADADKLRQILLNLLSNAVKFTAPGGRVWVEIGEVVPGQRIDLRIHDTGHGIPADKMSSIFEPFTQVDSSHSREGQGTGLGLAISRDLARGMGGDLTATSECGRGSVFTLSLQPWTDG